MNKKIDLSKYEGHTTTHWSARNQGDGSLDSCDDDYEHDEPFLETDGGDVGIGYMDGGRGIHSIEEKRANMRLMADAHRILEAYKRLVIVADELYLHIVGEPHMTLDELVAEMPWRNEE